MRIILPLASAIALVVCAVPMVSANPALLPKHPGYPMGKAVDPVKGQALANDPGQHNAGGNKALVEAAIADTKHVQQKLMMNRGDQRILEKPGAGLLPKVEGPAITIVPPVKSATKVNAAPK